MEVWGNASWISRQGLAGRNYTSWLPSWSGQAPARPRCCDSPHRQEVLGCGMWNIFLVNCSSNNSPTFLLLQFPPPYVLASTHYMSRKTRCSCLRRNHPTRHPRIRFGTGLRAFLHHWGTAIGGDNSSSGSRAVTEVQPHTTANSAAKTKGRSFPLPSSTQKWSRSRSGGWPDSLAAQQLHNSKAYNIQVESTQVILKNSFNANHIMDSCPDLRKTWNIRQCPFYQQVFQLSRNHLYCRSRSRSSFRTELRSS